MRATRQINSTAMNYAFIYVPEGTKKFNIIKLKNRIYTALHIKNSTIKQQINESNNKLRNEMIKRI